MVTESTPVFRTVRPFARSHPTRTSAGAVSSRELQPRGRAQSVTRVLGASRGGYARHRKERALTFARTPRPAASLAHASGARRAKAGARGLRLAGPRRGNAVERPTQPASVDAGEQWGESSHSRARFDGSQGVPTRRIRLQKSANDTEAPRSAIPQATGRADGPMPPRAREGPRRFKGLDNQRHGGQAEALGRSEPGVREDVAGEGLRSMEDTPGRHGRASRSRERIGVGLGGPRGVL